MRLAGVFYFLLRGPKNFRWSQTASPKMITKPIHLNKSCRVSFTKPMIMASDEHGEPVVPRVHRPRSNGQETRLLTLLDGERGQTARVDNLASPGADGALVVKVDEQPVFDPVEIRRIMIIELPKHLHRFGRAAPLVG